MRIALLITKDNELQNEEKFLTDLKLSKLCEISRNCFSITECYGFNFETTDDIKTVIRAIISYKEIHYDFKDKIGMNVLILDCDSDEYEKLIYERKKLKKITDFLGADLESSCSIASKFQKRNKNGEYELRYHIINEEGYLYGSK